MHDLDTTQMEALEWEAMEAETFLRNVFNRVGRWLRSQPSTPVSTPAAIPQGLGPYRTPGGVVPPPVPPRPRRPPNIDLIRRGLQKAEAELARIQTAWRMIPQGTKSWSDLETRYMSQYRKVQRLRAALAQAQALLSRR